MSPVSRPRAPLTLLALVLGFVLGLALVPDAVVPSAEAQAFRPRGRSAALTKVAPRKTTTAASTPAAEPAKTPARPAVTPAPRKAPAATPAKPVVAKKTKAKKKAKADDDEDVVVVDDEEDEDE